MAPTAPTDPVQAGTLTGTVAPDPAAARPSSDPAYMFEASFTVTLADRGGSAWTVISLGSAVQQSEGGVVVAPPEGASERYRFDVESDGRLPANGSLPVDFRFQYTLPNGGSEAIVTLTFNLLSSSGTTRLTVQAPLQ